MNYPLVLDELLSRDEMLKGIDPVFDDIHLNLKKLRKTNPRSKQFRPHKIVNMVKDHMIDYVKEHRAEHTLDDLMNDKGTDNTTECEGNHILTQPLGDNQMACELCPMVFEITPVEVNK